MKQNLKHQIIFYKKDFSEITQYTKGFKIDELFPLNASGIKTQRDDASIKFTAQECDDIKDDFINLSKDELLKNTALLMFVIGKLNMQKQI